jgi:hypothetical protein
MQRATISLFESGREEYKKKLKDFLITLNDNESNRQDFISKLYDKNLQVIEGQTQEFNAHLVKNFLALYNVLGDEDKNNFVVGYKLDKFNYLNPALFESLMDVSEKPEDENNGGTSTTLPSFIKPISFDKPSKPSKPSKPKFKIGDKYSLLVGNEETFFTIEDVEIDNIKIRYANGNYGNVEINNAESYVKKRVWKKIEQEKPNEEFKVGDVYYVELYKQKVTIEKVQDDTIFVFYEDDSTEQYTPQYCRLMVARKDWIKVVDEEITEQEQQYKVGDIFITADNKDLTFKIDFIQPDSIGVVYFDGLTAIINPEDFKKGLKSGYYKPYIKPEQETDLYFKQGDEFIAQNGNQRYRINIVDKFNNFVQYTIFNKAGKQISQNDAKLEIIQENIKRGYWIKKDAKPSKPSKPTSKPTTPTTLSDKDKQIKHILEINIEDIDF